MANLILPLAGTLDTDGTLFQLTQNGPTGGSGGIAIFAESYGTDRTGSPGVAVSATSDVGVAVQALTKSGDALTAESANGFSVLAARDPIFNQHAGVYGQSDQQGVFGHATTDTGTGVYGNSSGGGFGVRGESVTGVAVSGSSNSAAGLSGRSNGSVGVDGVSALSVGVQGNGGIAGVLGTSDTGTGLVGISRTGLAGDFTGDVHVSGIVRARDCSVTGADCAEHFCVAGAEPLEPGTVVVVDGNGALRRSGEAYDRKVAGVISGAGGFRPGILLDNRPTQSNRAPVALIGKVYCKVDAQYSPIEVGDLLTTSPTAGHAMKAVKSERAFGAVIGKALAPLEAGQGLIPILVTLQ